MRSVLNHVAFLVESIDEVINKNIFPKEDIQPLQKFDETYERYIGQEGQMARPLLMEAKETGSYRDALNKRGPGLHHIALDVLNIDEFISSINGSGSVSYTHLTLPTILRV